MPNRRGVTVTAYSPYQAYPGPAPVLAPQPPPILVAVADPRPQHRLMVFFRYIMAIPHLFVLEVLTFVGGIVAFIGWWGALFTGRLPQFAVSYLSGLLRWTTRVNAYLFLLTDAYPPFSFDDDPSYPVRVAIPPAQTLNRAAVFFRYFLAFPASLLTVVVEAGTGTLIAFIAWLVTLVTGRMPSALHLAFAAVLRLHVRLNGYFWMLTPAYPGGLYGDKPGTVAWADALPAARAPEGYGAPGYGTPGYGTPAGYGGPTQYAPPAGYGATEYGAPAGYGAAFPGYGAPVGYGAPGYGAPGGYGVQPAAPPVTWLLQLTSAARGLVSLFIVLGSLLAVAYIAVYAVLIGSTVSKVTSAATAINQLNSSYTTLTGKLDALDQSVQKCDQNLTCVTLQDGQAAAAFDTFSSQLANTSVPAEAAPAKARLAADAAAVAQDYTRFSKATSASQYQSVFASSNLRQALTDFDQDFNALTGKVQAAETAG
jgi:Domain of unknown function (DUF4389)